MSKTVTIVPARDPIIPMTEYGNQVAARISSERARDLRLFNRAIRDLLRDPEAQRLYLDPVAGTEDAVEPIADDESPEPIAAKVCEHCGKEFVPLPRNEKSQKRCSRKCTDAARAAQAKEKNKTAITLKERLECSTCGALFAPRNTRSRFCGSECLRQEKLRINRERRRINEEVAA